jgi:hypothetical protein
MVDQFFYGFVFCQQKLLKPLPVSDRLAVDTDNLPALGHQLDVGITGPAGSLIVISGVRGGTADYDA